MTYNFDPDRWYDNERAALERQFNSGELDAQAYAAAIEDLDRRHDEMLDRLDALAAKCEEEAKEMRKDLELNRENLLSSLTKQAKGKKRMKSIGKVRVEFQKNC